MNLKKISFLLLCLIFLASCANKSIYYQSEGSFQMWRLVTGIIIGIFLGITLFLLKNGRNEKIFDSTIMLVWISIFIAVLFNFLVFGEWFFKLFEWILASIIGKTILVIIFFVAGFWNGFVGNLSLWISSAFFWHSTNVMEFMLLPGIIGSAINFFRALFKNDFESIGGYSYSN
jgi:hypothetical protein